MEIREDIAHITLPDGRVFQILNEEGDDWDEEATRKAVESAENEEAHEVNTTQTMVEE